MPDHRGQCRQPPHHPTERPGEVALAFVVAGFLRDIGKFAAQSCAGEADPAAFGGEAEQGFRDRQDDELGVADPWWDSACRSLWCEFGVGVEVVVGGDVECGCESV